KEVVEHGDEVRAGDVLFDSGKATLKASAKKTLDNVASTIKSRYGANVVRIEGYTDTDPIVKSGWKSNERLSGERAMAVEEYLSSRGLPKDRIYYAGFGSSRPKSTKKDSRRVEIVILAKGE
ncbi:MAG: OmpA family protein, partial [Phycisphaerales bacterium]